jgi:hypothetical protein
MTWHDQEPEDAYVLKAVALTHTEGLAEVRLERAITGIDTTINVTRLLAASQLRLGEGGAGRRRG